MEISRAFLILILHNTAKSLLLTVFLCRLKEVLGFKVIYWIIMRLQRLWQIKLKTTSKNIVEVFPTNSVNLGEMYKLVIS